MFDSYDSCITKILCLNGCFSYGSLENVKLKIDNLKSLCNRVAKEDRNNRFFKKQCSMCLKKLINILQTSSSSQLQTLNTHEIIGCSIRILTLYDDCWYYQTENKWKILFEYNVAMVCYRVLLKIYIHVKPKEVTNAVLESIISEKLWRIEDLCEAIILDMLKHDIQGFLISSKLVHKMEQHISKIDDARNLSGLLEKFLQSYYWPSNDFTNSFIRKLLTMYHNIIQDSDEQSASLKRSLESNVKHLVQHLKNDSILIVLEYMCHWIVNRNELEDAKILDYGLLIELTACKHQTKLFTRTLTPEIFPLILRMISSSNRLISLLGHRILQYLMDRNKNKSYFSTPKIFLEESNFDIKIADCQYEDKLFVKSYREVIHDSIIRSMTNHCTTCLNLETSYCSMCLIAVEIPCGFTAASLVCLIMNMQNLILEDNKIEPQETVFHIHAIVVSIMSLLCWIHQAKIFYEYVNKIILKRAHWAPHLNPPLQMKYEHAAHHVLWNNPELFFVDWEVRYGLWKRFRLKNDERNLSVS